MPVLVAVPVGLGVFGQEAVAAVLGLVAVLRLGDRRRRPGARWFPGIAAAGAAVVLGAERWWAMVQPETFDPLPAQLAWQGTQDGRERRQQLGLELDS